MISSPVFVSSSANANVKGKGKEQAKSKDVRNEEGSVNVYGFDRVYSRMKFVGYGNDNVGKDVEGLMKIVLKRLEGGGDLELAAQRCVS